MSKVIAGITTSVDGYVAGPNDGPDCGLGEGGEELHYWVFGGPWTYDEEPTGDMQAEDKAWMDEAMGNLGAIIAGRYTYEAAGHWGETNPWDRPFFIVTHHTEDEPDIEDIYFVDSVEEAVKRADEVAGDKDVHIMGGADIIRQALAADLVDELTVIVAPVVLGGGKQLFDGFDKRVGLRHKGVRQSQYATFIDYVVER